MKSVNFCDRVLRLTVKATCTAAMILMTCKEIQHGLNSKSDKNCVYSFLLGVKVNMMMPKET